VCNCATVQLCNCATVQLCNVKKKRREINIRLRSACALELNRLISEELNLNIEKVVILLTIISLIVRKKYFLCKIGLILS
jgi:hypothetical protein